MNTNEVELFVAIGSERGVRPSDIVGTLANEFGVPGRAIGRINIYERKSFVGLPRAVGEELLSRTRSINIRGMDVRISPSRGRGGPPDR